MEMLSIHESGRKDGSSGMREVRGGNLAPRQPAGLLREVEFIRERDFPLLEEGGRVYLDNAATTQEPQSVKDRMDEYRRIHIRGSNHSRNSREAREAQERLDEAREKVASFFGAKSYQVGFTGGTTDSANWVASRFPFRRGDALIITEAEHNANILTARALARESGAEVHYLPVTSPEGRLDVGQLERIIEKRRGGKILLNLVHASNVTGIVNPVREIREILGDRGFINLDMAQSAGHMPVDLDSLDVDFAGLSAHKVYGPMGIGALFVNERSERYIGNAISGGSAVDLVSRHFTIHSHAPARFEPGTQNLEGAIEFGYALDYLSGIGMERIEAHDRALGAYFLEELKGIAGVRIYGPLDFEDRIAVISFNVGSFVRKNYDEVARELDRRGIVVRDGCFCAHIYTAQIVGVPKWVHEARSGLMKAGVSKDVLKLPGAVRASFAFYNNGKDAARAIEAIREIAEG